jgi:GNAT superfamily N-acetyltransferase
LKGFHPNELELHGYYPGAVGKITEAHAVYYYEHWGFDFTFETQVGKELSEFMIGFEENRDGLWIAIVNGKFAGSIVIDGRGADAEGARLRWFIVDSDFQGTGIGKALISRAIEFCKQKGYRRVYLWTFKGLEAARALYEYHQFCLKQEHLVDQWGQKILEQMFVLNL